MIPWFFLGNSEQMCCKGLQRWLYCMDKDMRCSRRGEQQVFGLGNWCGDLCGNSIAGWDSAVLPPLSHPALA